MELVTQHSFHPFILIFLLMPSALFFISLVFSALISILWIFCRDIQLGLPVPALLQLEHLYHRQTANWLLFLPPMLTFSSCFSRKSDMIRSRKMLKRVSYRRHPCFTPTVVLKHSPMLPFIWTVLTALS